MKIIRFTCHMVIVISMICVFTVGAYALDSITHIAMNTTEIGIGLICLAFIAYYCGRCMISTVDKIISAHK